jgi:hypothetical protein
VETASQIAIMLLSPLAMWLVNSKDKKHRLYGAVVGLISQPFWFYTSFYNGQWGIFIIAFVYAAAWVRGIINNK